jgi:hypothetical protein
VLATFRTFFGSHIVGNDWSTITVDVDDYATHNCASFYDNQPWYYGACWTAIPGYGGDYPHGPYASGAGYLDSWRIFVREGAEYVSVDPETVPEPSIIALLGLGLVGIGFARRRRQS